MLKKIILVVLGLLCVSGSFALLPDPPLEQKIATSLSILNEYYPQEKVYVQTDKDYYFSGRTIRYKAYVTLYRKPSLLSSNLYLDLLDEEGNIVQHQMRPVEEGGAYGDFPLDEDLPQGNYTLRAYTLWMRNFGEEAFFKKVVPVYEPVKEEEGTREEDEKEEGTIAGETAEKKENMFSVQFFPEGGEMIDSVKGLVAFKAVDRHGFPVGVTGLIKNKEGEILDTIASVHDGMGSFLFVPRAGESYTAEMSDESGNETTVTLPAARSHGALISLLKPDDEKVYFRVLRNVAAEKEAESYHLVVRSRDQVIFASAIDFSKGLVGGIIPLKELPSGVMEATLFSQEGVPLSERLFFKKSEEDVLPLNVETEEQSFEERGKNSFTISLPDSLAGNFSVAVTDADRIISSPNADNILSSLLLSSEINGAVFNPSWYFKGMDSATNHGLDLVMLTNGWRKFNWEVLLKDDFPELSYMPETKKISFSGETYDRKGAVPLADLAFILRSERDSVSYFMMGASDSTGTFEVDDLSFEDSADVYYKATFPEKKRKLADVRFDEPVEKEEEVASTFSARPENLFFDQFVNRAALLAKNSNDRDKYILSRGVLLKEVDVKAKRVTKEETISDRYTSGMFKSDNGYTFDLTEEHVPFINILQYLSGRVPGLMVSGSPTNPSVRWRGGTPGFYLDEMPSDVEQISTVPVDDIALIKVYRPPFMGGFGGGDGGIAIYTKRGGDATYSPGIGFEKYKIAGYSITREFYSPDYSEDKRVNELDDERTTLYWNPKLERDSVDQKLHISFYNSDVGKRYRMVVEGMTEDGRMARIEKVLE